MDGTMSEGRGLFVGVEHPGVAVRDTRAMAEWYCRVFELKVVYTNHAEPPAFMLKAADGRLLEILPATPGEPTRYGQFQHGLRHLAWEVTDFDAAWAHLKQQGISEFFDHRETDDVRLVFFPDPEGNLMHIVWRARPMG